MALVDSNWASSWDAKSTSSGVIMGNGAALVSLVKLQKLPAHSSCEAELIAMDDIVREIAFMLNLMKEFGMKLKKPLVILEDNQSTISLCYNKVQNQRSKHIDVRYLWPQGLTRDPNAKYVSKKVPRLQNSLSERSRSREVPPDDQHAVG